MSQTGKWAMRFTLAMGCAITFAAGVANADYPACPQKHAGRQSRTESLVKKGDSKMVHSAVGHTLDYAVIRYGISDIVNPADKARATAELYDFLCWKMGSTSAVAGQWLTAGYQHFDKGYVDEAAAALLGAELPGPAGTVRLPKELSDYLKSLADSLAQSGDSANGFCGAGADSTLWGVGCKALLPLVLEAAHRAIDRIGFNVTGVMAKRFDVKDEQIALMIETRRHPVAGQPASVKMRGQPTGASGLHLPRR